jgi:hypothetical protein
MTPAARTFRAIGAFLWNLLTAIVGTTIIDAETHSIFPPPTLAGRLLREDILGAIVAFGLGYFVYYKWKSTSAKWIWTLGVFWLGLRALHVVAGAHGTLFAEIFGGRAVLDAPSFNDWDFFTLPFFRTVFYSAGAFCCYRSSAAMRSGSLGTTTD